MLTTVGTLWKRWDLKSHIIIFHRMPLTILRVPCRCISPLLPCRHWPSPTIDRIGVYSVIDGFIPPPDSPSYTCPGIAYEAAPFAFMLRPAVLAGTPGQVRPMTCMSLRGTVSGQVQPACYHANPPPAYSSIRATDETISFQIIR